MGCPHCCTAHDTDAWAPISLTWSVVRPGDIILAAQTRLPWIVTAVFGAEVTAVRGSITHRATPDPAGTVDVLVPLAERDALATARNVLGAEVTGRNGPQ